MYVSSSQHYNWKTSKKLKFCKNYGPMCKIQRESSNTEFSLVLSIDTSHNYTQLDIKNWVDFCQEIFQVTRIRAEGRFCGVFAEECFIKSS